MKTPQQLSQEIIDIIKATGNYFVGNTSGMSNDGTVNVYHPKGYSISAIAANPISSGEVIVFKVNDTWYAFGEQRTVVKQDVLIQRKLRGSEVIYPVITLIQSEFRTFNPIPRPEGHKDYEYWLTGGQYSLTRITTDPSPAFDSSDAFPLVDGGDAFLQNDGNGKYILATSYFIPYATGKNHWGGSQIFIIQKVNKQTVRLAPTFAGGYFNYLGNGIYQSQIEDGIGKILAEIPQGLVPIGSITQYYRYGYNPITNNPDTYADGLGKDFDYFPGTFAWIATKRRNTNITPENKNIVIHDGVIQELSGTIFVDLTGIFNFTLRTIIPGNLSNQVYPSLTLTKLRQSSYLLSEEIIQSTDPYDPGSYLITLIDCPFYGWRAKSISHQIWLPNTNSTFTYNSTPQKLSSTKYRYTETMSGELLLGAWSKKYITYTFTNVTKVSTYDSNPSEGEFEFTEYFTNSGNQILKLKSYGNEGEAGLILNSTDKFLILPNIKRRLDSDNVINFFTSDIISFRVRINKTFNNAQLNSSINLDTYLNNNVITSDVINGRNYLIRGYIESIDDSFSSVIYFTIRITGKQQLPTISTEDVYIKKAATPFSNAIVLDNGCFWNFYFNFKLDSVNIESFRIDYLRLNYKGDVFSAVQALVSYSDQLICDQTVKFVHTNPITMPFCAYHLFRGFFPVANLIKCVNLDKNSFYSVDNYELLEQYIDSYAKSDLKIPKLPISEWKIENDGSIRYKKTFLVDYILNRPYYDPVADYARGTIQLLVAQSYHP